MTWKTTSSKVDAVIGAVIGTIIAMNILLGSGFLLFESARSYPTWQRGLCSLFFLWCMVTEIWFVLMAWGVILKQEAPAAVAVAMRQPRLPAALRPVAGLWWLFQFLMGVVWGVVLTIYEKSMPIWTSVIVAVSISGFAYLTFGYLILAITAFTKRHDIIIKVWGWRGRWALLHGLIIVATKVFFAPYGDLK